MRSQLTVAALLLGACSGSKDPVDTGSTSTTDDIHVMRDCAPGPGIICPWAGDGYNGWNGDAVHRLDAWFSFPMSVVFPPPGINERPILADWNNHKLRAVNDDPEAGFETIMGTDFLGDGDPDLADATPAGALGTDVALNHPTMAQWDADGTLLADTWHTHKFRSWDPATRLVHVVLGSAPGIHKDAEGKPIDFDDEASLVRMNQPKQLLIDPTNTDRVYYIDMRNQRIRLWDRGPNTVSTVAGETVDINADGKVGSRGYCGEGNALETCFTFPDNANPEPGGAIALSEDGNRLFIADSESHIIRVLDRTTGQIALVSGSPGEAGFQDGAAADARWNYPVAFALDHATNELFVADTNNHRIRKIDLGTMQVSTVAGTGFASCGEVDETNLLVPRLCDEQHLGGDGGLAVDATLYRPFGVDFDPDGNLIVADTYNQRFRIIYR